MRSGTYRQPNVDPSSRTGNRKIVPVIATAVCVGLGAAACGTGTHAESTSSRTTNCYYSAQPEKTTIPAFVPEKTVDGASKAYHKAQDDFNHRYAVMAAVYEEGGWCFSPDDIADFRGKTMNVMRTLNIQTALQVEQMLKTASGERTTVDDTSTKTSYSVSVDPTTKAQVVRIASPGFLQRLTVTRDAKDRPIVDVYMRQEDPFTNSATRVHSGFDSASGTKGNLEFLLTTNPQIAFNSPRTLQDYQENTSYVENLVGSIMTEATLVFGQKAS